MCKGLDTMPACDGQTDGQTRCHSPRYAYASRNKNETAQLLDADNDNINISGRICIHPSIIFLMMRQTYIKQCYIIENDSTIVSK